MIRKILKWIGIVLGSLIGLLILAIAVLYIISTSRALGDVSTQSALGFNTCKVHRTFYSIQFRAR